MNPLKIAPIVLAVNRDQPDPDVIDQAAEVLRRDGLVAFPTETVYGLGANATSDKAVARIFAAKGRPSFNPLIVHIGNLETARICASHWPESAERLAQRFWPGPLTLVMQRSTYVSDAATAGLDTVALRVPANAVARALIERFGMPLAAPSANRSTRVSPTLASHVLKDLNGSIEMILDAGPTAIGIESTVLDLSGQTPTILRPGPIALEELQEALGCAILEGKHVSGAIPKSPGMMPVHYAPRTRALRISATALAEFKPRDGDARWALIVLGRHEIDLEAEPVIRIDLPDSAPAGQAFYRVLHQIDDLGLDLVLIVEPPDESAWSGLRDRLSRATQPYLKDH